MKKVLLIQPPIRDFYRTAFREYPLGLLYVASSLRSAGHKVSLLDARKCKRPKSIPYPIEFLPLKKYFVPGNDLFLKYQHFGISLEEIEKKVEAEKPDIVCISSMFTPYFEEVCSTASAVKRTCPSCVVIVGGHHATADPTSLLEHDDVDRVVIGEASDLLLWPARDLLNADEYRIGRRRYAQIITSRGCPYSCSFCSTHAVAGHVYRKREIDDVLAEIDECIKKYRVSAIDFQDDNLLFDSERAKVLFERLASRYETSDVEFLASNGLNAHEIDAEMIALLERCGFRKLDVALGTGPVSYRDKLERPETLIHYEELLSEAWRHDIPVTTYIIIGIPTQPFREMVETFEYLKTKNTLVSPSVFYNVPGMPIFEEMKKYEYCSSHIARRSSAFNCSGEDFEREDIIELFKKIRKHNLRKLKC